MNLTIIFIIITSAFAQECDLYGNQNLHKVVTFMITTNATKYDELIYYNGYNIEQLTPCIECDTCDVCSQRAWIENDGFIPNPIEATLTIYLKNENMNCFNVELFRNTKCWEGDDNCSQCDKLCCHHWN